MALEAANMIAPEHLEVMMADPLELLGAIQNAGAIFLGPWTPESVGDYVAGPNHVLPTGRHGALLGAAVGRRFREEVVGAVLLARGARVRRRHRDHASPRPRASTRTRAPSRSGSRLRSAWTVMCREAPAARRGPNSRTSRPTTRRTCGPRSRLVGQREPAQPARRAPRQARRPRAQRHRVQPVSGPAVHATCAR